MAAASSSRQRVSADKVLVRDDANNSPSAHLVVLDLPGLPSGLLTTLAASLPDARLALVGGAVRDWLLHRQHRDPWRGLMDLDLVVEIPARHFIDALSCMPSLEQFSAREHGRYGTVELDICYGGEELLLDVARARRERYPQPAGKPVVEFDCLEADLARRDFSINAMALLLDPSGHQPELLDPYGGLADLEHRELRFLHPHSLRDDPTRLIRAARYGARLGFHLAPESVLHVRQTLMDWPWGWAPQDDPLRAPVSLATRLRMEFELLLTREPWADALRLLQSWGGLRLLDASLQEDLAWRRRLHWAQRMGVPLLPALIAPAPDSLAIAQRLQLPHTQQRLLGQWMCLRERLTTLTFGGCGTAELSWRPSSWTQWLEQAGCTPEAVALALAVGVSPRRPLLRWWLSWRHQVSPLSPAELMAQGVAPGPELGHQLRQMRLAKIDQLEKRMANYQAESCGLMS